MAAYPGETLEVRNHRGGEAVTLHPQAAEPASRRTWPRGHSRCFRSRGNGRAWNENTHLFL